MEWFTAHLAEDKLRDTGRGGRKLEVWITREWGKNITRDLKCLYLDVSAARAQEAEQPGRDRHGGEQAEAASLPHLLHIVVPLEIHSDAMHSVAGDPGHHLALSRGSAQAV